MVLQMLLISCFRCAQADHCGLQMCPVLVSLIASWVDVVTEVVMLPIQKFGSVPLQSLELRYSGPGPIWITS